MTPGGHAERAFEHLTRSGKHAGLNGHVSLRLFECHTIPHTISFTWQSEFFDESIMMFLFQHTLHQEPEKPDGICAKNV
jgi:hypothetical protein